MITPEPWPAEIETGLIPTDNAMGVMTRELSPAAIAFVADAVTATRPLLEIGAAYGNATLPALGNGATVIACDLSASELAVLAAAATPEQRRHLVILPARFPDGIVLGEGSLAAVLAAQVLHFLDGSALERAFADVHRWLAPGGAFHGLVMTPSLSYYHLLRPAYEARVAAGLRWPGIFDPQSVAPPEWRARLPKFVHLFEADILRRCADEAGFAVETLEYFCFSDFPDIHRTDGHEYLTFTLRKPAT